jgi:Tol biopolymer transport system component
MLATRIRVPLFIAMHALTACDATTPQELPPPAVLVVEAVTPVSATGVVGEELAVAPVVLVIQADGLPVKGILVSFAVSGSGTVGSVTVMTNAAGLASAGAWRLGPGAGPQTLTARAAGHSVVFTADAQAGPITTLTVVGGNSQWAVVGTRLPAALRVKATDDYGNVVADQSVTFTVVDGGGSLEPGASITGPDGIAESRWILGTTAGRQHVRAQAGEDATALFTADACQPACSFELAHVLNGNIVLFNGATGSTQQLTSNGVSYDPAWSPAGERIAFARYSDSAAGIYVMNSDGTGVTRVTKPGFRSPTWSPQSDALAFSGGSFSGCPGDQYCGAVYVQELNQGTAMRQVAASGFAPAWSPDGTRIAFIGHNGLIADQDYYSLRLVNPDGSGLTEITPVTWFYMDGVTWSPDGTRIAFTMGGDIWVVRADGTGSTRLTTYAGALAPAWSPDGTRIAFGTRGNSIMEIPADGGEPTLMSSGQSPSWRP